MNKQPHSMDEETSSEMLGNLPGSQCKAQRQSQDSSSGLLTSRTLLLYAQVLYLCQCHRSNPKPQKSSVSKVSQVLAISSDNWQRRFLLFGLDESVPYQLREKQAPGPSRNPPPEARMLGWPRRVYNKHPGEWGRPSDTGARSTLSESGGG